MRKFSKLWGFIPSVVLAACAAQEPSFREPDEAQERVGTWEEGCKDHRSLLFLCGENVCAFYHCRDLVAEVPRVVQTRGVGGMVAPGATASAMRWWGSPQALPESAEPVFIIPWHNHDRRPLLPSEQQLLAQAEARARLPKERHHIFPQESKLKEWFMRKGIDVHEFTLLLDVDVHKRIHRGANGGPWNEAWRNFKDANEEATKVEIWHYAGELIFRFELFGPVLPYYRYPTSAAR